LVNLIHDLIKLEAGLKVLAGEGSSIDTTTANGRLMFGFFAALLNSSMNSSSSARRRASRRLAPVGGTAGADSR